VHLLTGIDHLRLAPSLTPPLDNRECAELLRSVNDAIEHHGCSLVAVDERRWLLACRDTIDCETHEPAAAAGRDIRDLMPQGRDGRAMRRVMNEMQMALHEHPLSEQREARGQPSANAVWLWGFGAARPVEPRRLPPLASDDDWLDDLWRMYDGTTCATTTEALRSIVDRPGPKLVAALDRVNVAASPPTRLRDCEQNVFVPLRRAIQSGAIASVELHSGAAVHRFGRISRWAFWRRRAAPRGRTA